MNSSKSIDGQFTSSLAVHYIAALKDCTREKNLLKGKKLHDEIEKKGLLIDNVYIGSTLINLYAKCGELEKAQEVLDGQSIRNVVLWNTLISGYVQQGHAAAALKCFERMQLEGFSPDAITLTCALKACAALGDYDKGQQIHIQAVRERLLAKDPMLANSVIDMYAKNGVLEKAEEVFNELNTSDVVSWNALLTGYAQNGHGKKALQLYTRMKSEGLSPNSITYTCILKACGSIGALDVGQEVHYEIKKEGFLQRDSMLANALIDMYAKCGSLDEAQNAFEEIPFRNVISWTSLISGYVQHGYAEKALEIFNQMQSSRFMPNAVTFSCILKACGTIGCLDKGQEIHAMLLRQPVFEEDFMVSTALVDMYVKCGALKRAQEIFDEIPVWDIVTWNALIAGYVHHDLNEEALRCFDRMQQDGCLPDAATYACILKACGGAGAVRRGQNVHADIVKQAVLEEHKDINIGLVIMYTECGMLTDAQEIFDKLPVRDVVAWSVLMAGYSQVGEDKMVLKLFAKMIESGVEPNLVTFTVVLNTCSHRGLLEEGQMYYEMISKDYGLTPTLEHHTCMVDLFCRVGDLDGAVVVIKSMEVSPNLALWHTFLGACVVWKNVKYGRWAFENAVALDEKDGTSYVSMSNLYTAVGRLDDAMKMEALRLERLQGNSVDML
ncbi:hypothetical protein KP509_01G041400 [Ceratopteris richardii]|nr:hypothetical protein KP509_01G041400 [Ceratopteris richardii]